MNTIAAEWESFKRDCLPAKVSKIQVDEMRRAFYCGFGAAAMRSQKLAEADTNEYREFVLAMNRGEA